MSETKSKAYRLLLVDDHPLVRRGLAELISDEPNLEVCDQASSGEEALKMLTSCEPDAMIIDVTLPGMSGLELIKRIRARRSQIRILVASMHDDSLFAERCLRAGANGYINKEVATARVLEAIKTVLAGKTYVSTEMALRLPQATIAGGSRRYTSIDALTDRELEVFALIGRGLSTRDIAEKLHLSVKTIETHRDHIRAKLNLEGTYQLVRHAVQWVLENG